MTRIEADDAMASYDRSKEAYRLAVRLGLPNVDQAFEAWNREREALIDRLCADAEEAA